MYEITAFPDSNIILNKVIKKDDAILHSFQSHEVHNKHLSMLDQYMFLAMITAESCFFGQVSYMILQRVSPVTHSVGNCVKRVVVIVSSVLFFRTPVSPINSLGITDSL